MASYKDLIRNKVAYVSGRWSSGGNSYPVYEPATGELLGEAANMGKQETLEAIDAAQSAFLSWSGLLAAQRGEILRRWYELIIENRAALAELLTREQGKPLAEADGEVAYAAGFVKWYSEEATRIYGQIIPSHKRDARVMVLKQPIGVAGAITPWNFPYAMITRKVAPALAVGCTVVIKPAGDTPFCALALAWLGEKAGIPGGVVNVITGSDPVAIGEALTASPKVRALSFTGSTEVGRILMRQSAANIKKLSLELGGNAPFIVFDDCDISSAVAGAIASKYRNSGQTCVCTNRFLVQSGVYDQFARMLGDQTAKIKVGNGLDTSTNQGPLINQQAVTKVEAHIADALAKGAKILTGGARHPLGGTFFEPTVMVDMQPDMLVTKEETFGPLAALYRFDSEDEAIALANDSEFGLAAYFYTRDISRVMRVAEKLESGIIGINEGVISNPSVPFGGVKQSGLGREGGHFGTEEYLETKYLLIGGL